MWQRPPRAPDNQAKLKKDVQAIDIAPAIWAARGPISFKWIQSNQFSMEILQSEEKKIQTTVSKSELTKFGWAHSISCILAFSY